MANGCSGASAAEVEIISNYLLSIARLVPVGELVAELIVDRITKAYLPAVLDGYDLSQIRDQLNSQYMGEDERESINVLLDAFSSKFRREDKSQSDAEFKQKLDNDLNYLVLIELVENPDRYNAILDHSKTMSETLTTNPAQQKKKYKVSMPLLIEANLKPEGVNVSTVWLHLYIERVNSLAYLMYVVVTFRKEGRKNSKMVGSQDFHMDALKKYMVNRLNSNAISHLYEDMEVEILLREALDLPTEESIWKKNIDS